MEITKESLRAEQQKVVEKAEEAYNTAPFELKGLCKDILTAQRTILRRLGWEAKPKSNTTPKKGFFKKPSKMAGELEIDENPKQIDNKPKKGMFKPSEVLEVEDSKPIDNKPKKGMFEAEEVVATSKEKDNPKRLNQKAIGDIKALALDGYNPVEISDKLMIVIEKVNGVLAKMRKKKTGNVLATSNKKGSSLENEIRNSQ